jgi:hypothetical protein
LGFAHGGWGGIRTLGTLRYTRSPGVPNRPLWHPSERDYDTETSSSPLQLISGDDVAKENLVGIRPHMLILTGISFSLFR